MSNDGKAPPKSAFIRTSRLLGAGFSAAKAELKQRAKAKFESNIEKVKEFSHVVRREQIELLTKTLGELKGSAMKAGQMLALEAQEFLPPEFHPILARLYESAQPVADSLMLEIIEKELGPEKFKNLNLEPKSIAAASIGQVYLGLLDGKKVVVKVQYPGVADTVDSDIDVLRRIVSTSARLIGKTADLKEFFEELKIVLKNETNYVAEVQNMIKYSKFLESDNRFEVPKPQLDYCTKKVITMTYMEGVSLSNWIGTKPSVEESQFVGTAILDLFCKEFYDNGFVQTDPNLGNFKYDPATRTLKLLDFGAVLTYSPKFVEEYTKIIQAVYQGDKKTLIERAIAFELLAAGENQDVYDKFYQMMEVSIRPFQPDVQPFDFSDKDYTKETRDVSFAFIKSLKKTPPPRHIVFLHRKLGGIYALMKKLEIQMNLLPFWKRITEG